MTKTELVDFIAKEAKITKLEANKALDSTTKAIMDTIKKGEKVTLVGFGTFSMTERKEREGRNPRTGDAITIPEARVPRFVPGKAFRNAVKG